MAIQVDCDCGKTYRVADDIAGKRFRCSVCEAIVDVPDNDPDDLENDFEDFEDVDDLQDWDTPQSRQGRRPAKTPRRESRPQRKAARKRKRSEPEPEEEEDSDWLNETFGPTGAAILALGALILAPIAFWMAAAYLNLDALRGRAKLLPGAIIWGVLVIIVLGPVAVVIKAPAIGSMILGPKRYRKRWLSLQLGAWIGSVAYAAIGVAWWMGPPHSRGIGEAIGMHSLQALLGLLALYVGVMGCMPAKFFEQDRMGRMMCKFVGSQTSRGVPIRCIGSAIGLAIISGSLWWLVASTFSR